jgi:hypothetical protein
MMTMATKLDLEVTYEQAEQVLGWQKNHRSELELDNLGFTGDEDCVALGLETMEDEVTMEDASRLHYLARGGVIMDRRKAIAIPISSATVDEARDARAAEHYGDREWEAAFDDVIGGVNDGDE